MTTDIIPSTSVEGMSKEEAKEKFVTINVYSKQIDNIATEGQNNGISISDTHERLACIGHLLLQELPQEADALLLPQTSMLVVRYGLEELPAEKLKVWLMKQVVEYTNTLAFRTLASDKHYS